MVKVSIVLVAIIVLLIAAVMLLARSGHGPWRHFSSEGVDRSTAPQFAHLAAGPEEGVINRG
ncbi:MAG: hypothetical protein C4521_04775 [Actinobacteria bacterium]|nr:MAG: hypothetical protein C4521_04775 [Actinomycetota bacterium]